MEREVDREEQELVAKWVGRVELAKRYQDKFGNTDGRWEKNVRALAGDFNSVAELGSEAIDVHMIRAASKIATAPLTLVDPFIVVRPEVSEYNKQDNVVAAEKAELEINYWFKELEARKAVRKAVVDADCTNSGYVYVGYTKAKADAYDTGGERRENDPTIRHRQPFFKRISPRDVLVPPGYWDLEECPWIDLVFRVPLRHVKEKFGVDEVPTSEQFDPGDDVSARFGEYLDSEDCKIVHVHNVWDKETKKVYVFAWNDDKFLEKPKSWPFEVEGFPVAHLRFEDVSDQFYATPPISYSLPQNKELNAARTAMRKRFNRTKSVVWIDEEVPEEAIEQYKAAEDGAVIKAGGGDKPLNQRLMVDNGLPFDASSLAYGQTIQADLLQSQGVSAEQRGAGDPNVDSATASANIEKNSQVRSSDRGDRVRDLYLQMARKLYMILIQFPDEKRTRRIVGPRHGQVRELTYTLEEIRGEFRFDLDIAAMMADNPATRQVLALQNYNLLRADPLINPETLIYDIFKSQNKVNPEAYMLFLRSPEQELEMMLQRMPVEAHERDNHEQHIQAHDAQTDIIDEQIGSGGEKTAGLRATQVLLVSHIQDHVAKLQRLTGETKRPGSPIAENMLRNQIKASKGGETQAELTGNPLGEGMVQ